MKVMKKLVIALSLAVPISPISLVTADELVIKETFKPGTADYSPDIQEALKLAPLEFKDMTVVPVATETAGDLPARSNVVNRTVSARP